MLATVIGATALAPTRAAAAPVAFTPEERRIIATLRPSGSPFEDRTNAVVADPRAQDLGRALFFETRLSRSGRFSCASCHKPSENWTDHRPISRGEGVGSRNTPTLWNVARRRWFFWDGRADTLWSQALVPIEGAAELGSDRRAVVATVMSDRRLRTLYRTVFGDPPEALLRSPQARDASATNIAFTNIGKALAAFESTLQRAHAPFDVFAEGLLKGDSRQESTISESAKRGLKVFIGRGNCVLCHNGPEFTDEEFHDDRVPTRDGTRGADSGRYGGLGYLAAKEFTASSGYSDDPSGTRGQLTKFQRLREDARRQFRTPSLRNVALTAPYMHAGQLPTLRSVVEFYSRMPAAHDSSGSQEALLGSLNLSPSEISDLVSFLESLTGAEPEARIR